MRGLSLPLTGRARRLMGVGAVGASLACSSCAVNQYGLVTAEVIPIAGGWIEVDRVLGAHLRLASDDLELSLGYSERRSVYDGALPDGVAPGRHFFVIPSWGRAPVLVDSRVVGVIARGTGPTPALTIGYEALVATSQDAAASGFLAVDYEADTPETSSVKRCGGPYPC